MPSQPLASVPVGSPVGALVEPRLSRSGERPLGRRAPAEWEKRESVAIDISRVVSFSSATRAMGPQPHLSCRRFQDIEEVRARLQASSCGWAVVHESPNLAVVVLAPRCPTPDRPVSHTADEVYLVLACEAPLGADEASRRLRPGDAAFVAVGKERHFARLRARLGPGSLRSRWLRVALARPRPRDL
jgi:hypothetical protein